MLIFGGRGDIIVWMVATEGGVVANIWEEGDGIVWMVAIEGGDVVLKGGDGEGACSD